MHSTVSFTRSLITDSREPVDTMYSTMLHERRGRVRTGERKRGQERAGWGEVRLVEDQKE